MTFILHHFKGYYSDNGSWWEVRGVNGRNYCLGSKFFNVQIMFLNASHVNIFVILSLKTLFVVCSNDVSASDKVFISVQVDFLLW